MKAHRDEDTGEVVVNGRMGALRAWARWFQPILVSVTSGVVLTVALGTGVQLIQHRDQHRDQVVMNETFQEFVDAGDRFAAAPAGHELSFIKDVPTLVAYQQLEIQEAMADLPPDWFEEKVDANAAAIQEIRKDIKVLLQRTQ